MIKNPKDAYKIAKKTKGYKKAEACYCQEDKVSYYFVYSIHGLPVLRVYKEDGHTEQILFGDKCDNKDKRQVSLKEII